MASRPSSVVLCAALLGALAAGAAPYIHPQYLCLNKMYGCTTQPGCWNEGVPSSLTQASIDLFLAGIGGARGGLERRLCLGFQIDALDGSTPETHAEVVSNLLGLSLANDLPIVVRYARRVRVLGRAPRPVELVERVPSRLRPVERRQRRVGELASRQCDADRMRTGARSFGSLRTRTLQAQPSGPLLPTLCAPSSRRCGMELGV